MKSVNKSDDSRKVFVLARKKMNDADVSVVVVDSGSWKTRVGIAGEASPRAEMTSVVGNHISYCHNFC